MAKTLPIAWVADTVPEATALITRLHDSVDAGVDLADALDRKFGSISSKVPSSSTRWPLLMEQLREK